MRKSAAKFSQRTCGSSYSLVRSVRRSKANAISMKQSNTMLGSRGKPKLHRSSICRKKSYLIKMGKILYRLYRQGIISTECIRDELNKRGETKKNGKKWKYGDVVFLKKMVARV
jgi:hypothetical protein